MGSAPDTHVCSSVARAGVSLTTVSKWIDDIVAAVRLLGGAGSYEQIYAEVAPRRSNLTAEWKATVRGTIEQHSSDSKNYRHPRPDLFRAVPRIGSGNWALRSYEQTEPDSSGVVEEPDSPQGYAMDSVVRTAIERYAVGIAKGHYLEQGASEVVELGKPYDLRVLVDGEEKHVEVKGSLRALTSVILTRNEVRHARETPRTELVVVDRIRMTTDTSGDPSMSGGKLRIWKDWAPADESLVVKAFDHALGAGHTYSASVGDPSRALARDA